MRNTLHGSWHRIGRRGQVLALGALAACSDGKGTVDPDPNPGVATPLTLSVFGAQTVSGAGGVTFVNAGKYAVIPQFAATTDFATGTGRSTVPDYPFMIGGVGTVTARTTAGDSIPIHAWRARVLLPRRRTGADAAGWSLLG